MAYANSRGPTGAGTPRRMKSGHRSLEQSVLLLALVAGLPSSLILLYLTWSADYGFEVRWTITAIVVRSSGSARRPARRRW
jgi:hypothetical protein